MNNIKVFQVDDWAYVAALSAEDAQKYLETKYSRPDCEDERECDEVTHLEGMKKIVDIHATKNGKIPALLGIDPHYA